MTVLVDMDDTIEGLLQAWVRGVNEAYGTAAAYDDVLSWDVSAAFPGLTREQVYEVPLRPGFWSTVEPIPGAADVLQRLLRAGHEVYIVTATQFENVPEKLGGFLKKYFPFLTRDNVIVTTRKQRIRGDVLIDDGVHNLEGGDYVKILMTAPPNKTYDAEANDMLRVQNWAEIEAALNALARQRGERCI